MACEMTSQELSMKDALATLKEKSKDIRNKEKSSTYKLLFYFKTTKNLKGILEERVFNAKVEFILKEILRFTKKKNS